MIPLDTLNDFDLDAVYEDAQSNVDSLSDVLAAAVRRLDLIRAEKFRRSCPYPIGSTIQVRRDKYVKPFTYRIVGIIPPPFGFDEPPSLEVTRVHADKSLGRYSIIRLDPGVEVTVLS